MNYRLSCVVLLLTYYAVPLYGIEEESIFENINHEGFTCSPIFDLLLKTGKGRANLLMIRLGELTKENSFCGILKHIGKPDIRVVGSGSLYNHRSELVAYFSDRDITQSNVRLRIFTAGIGALEDAFIRTGSMMSQPAKAALEKTRVHDLFLLKSILEEDNFFYIQDAKPYTLPEELSATHTDWPPLSCITDVQATSAYTVITDALKTRKERGVDLHDISNYQETWSFEVLPSSLE
jgi:hypothetical protein